MRLLKLHNGTHRISEIGESQPMNLSESLVSHHHLGRRWHRPHKFQVNQVCSRPPKRFLDFGSQGFEEETACSLAASLRPSPSQTSARWQFWVHSKFGCKLHSWLDYKAMLISKLSSFHKLRWPWLQVNIQTPVLQPFMRFERTILGKWPRNF